MRSRTKKIIMLFMAIAILVLPVRFALATSFMAQHSSDMEMMQDSDSFSHHVADGDHNTDHSSHHANHADMDMEAVVVKEDKQPGACSCDDTCSGGCSHCPHINLGIVSAITPTRKPEHEIWLLTNEDSIGIVTHVEISPPNTLFA